MKRQNYSHLTDCAINALLTTSKSLIGDTIQARELIMALCDQAGASRAQQQRIAAALMSCANCGSTRHARCCSFCGKKHDVARLFLDHCSDRCERLAQHADEQSMRSEVSDT